MSRQPDGSYLKVSDMPRQQLEEEYSKVCYFLTRILKVDGVTVHRNPHGRGVIAAVSLDPMPAEYRIWYSQSADGEVTFLEVRPFP